MTTQGNAEATKGALDGIRVLDLSFFAPGRVASLLLGDLGADVICIEMPRGVRPSASRLDEDTSSRWLFYQRNKKSITLNLKTDGGLRVFRELVKKADVVIESYKPGTARKLGADYDAVSAINPQVIYCSVSGFGQTGPYSQYIGHEPNYQGLSGVLAHNHLEGQPPTMLPALVGDLGGGAMSGVIAILGALLYRERTGEGQYLDVAITSGILPLLGSLPYAQWLGEEYRATSFSSGHRAAFRPYETKDGKYVGISPSEPWLWARFCHVIGRPDLLELRHASSGESPDLLPEMKKIFLSRTQDEWVELNERENLAVTAVLGDIRDIENDPQMKHREVIVEIDYEPLGPVKQIKTPFKMSKTPPTVRWIPRYGEHTDSVLAEAGFDDEQIKELRAEGACE
jgi:crotonobetainyl-CoA:carnitine CoA-transferase CaiB-like acyl-CoA transferase